MDPPHIAIRPLNSPDFAVVKQLETLGFPPNERCSSRGLKYRLKTCPELCSGLFIREFSEGIRKQNNDSNDVNSNSQNSSNGMTNILTTGPETDGIVGNGGHFIKETLIGHILATKIDGKWISEESMSVPDDFVCDVEEEEEEEAENSNTSNEHVLQKGHVESSNTIGIHSLVIHPDHQKKNLATLLMNDFIQKLSNLSVGDRIVIISKEKLIPFYERLGFISKGESQCHHGGEEWFDLERVLEHNDDDM